MRLEFHKHVASDISRIMDYYENVAGPELADEFYTVSGWFHCEYLYGCGKSLFTNAQERPMSSCASECDLRKDYVF